jgi:hypothetical protein
MIETRFGHSLSYATMFDEVAFERYFLPVEQIVGLIDETDCNVCNYFSRAGIAEFTVGFESGIWLLGEISDIESFLRIRELP